MKLRSFGIRLRLLLKKFVIDVRHTHLKDLRNTFLLSLKKLPDIVHLKNLVLFGSILSFVTLSLFVQRFSSLSEYYQIEKPDFGGSYSQGVVGSISKINPLFIQNDAEKAANLMIFSGLTRVVNSTAILPDIAERWEIKGDGKIYDFHIKKGVKWHDGEPFSVDDVVYTVGLIQNTDTKTSLESIWKGVLVEKVSEDTVRFTLPNPYPNFLSVASQAILPKHLLGSIDAKNVKVAEYNYAPVGTGPYKFVRFDQLGSQPEVVLKRNDKFQIAKPYIDQFKIVTYDNHQEPFDGVARKQIDGVLKVSPEDYGHMDQISGVGKIYKETLPEYQVLFFNTKSPGLTEKDVRIALSASIDKQELIDKTMSGNAQKQNSPILSGQPGYSAATKGVEYNPSAAGAILDKLGWIVGADGYRAKDGKRLELRLVYPDTFESREDAKLVKIQLAKVGVDIVLLKSEPEQIGANYVRPRNFDLLLLHQNAGYVQDWYSLWSSTQVESPGLNLSGFSDKALDRFVEQVRTSNDKKYVSDRLKQAEQIILEQAPVVYLYRPSHFYAQSTRLKGFEQSKISKPSDILNNVYKWYVNVKK